jgi:uncharacterized protein
VATTRARLFVNVERLSLAQARRVALAAQGFADPAPAGVPDRRALRRVIGRTGVFQIDSVNVLARAHYLPMFSRVGPYPVSLVDRAAYRAPRELFEYWGHVASLLPVETYPLLRWRMDEAHTDAWGGMVRIAKEQPGLVADVLAEVRRSGPLSAGEIEESNGGRTKRAGPWWDWSHVKRAIEYLFWAGEVTTSSRRGFERLYDVPERVLPPAVLAAPVPDRADAQRELLRRAARSLGVADSRDLRDYYRLSPADTKAGVDALVESGELLPVAVEGWRRQGYLFAGAAMPRRMDAVALLSPFDPVVWERDRTERLFGFRYRIEIYVPAPQRVHGYYVLPFLLGDRLAGRVDLKADRATSRLLVQAAYAEPHAPAETGEEMVGQLRRMASWLGLESVVTTGRGDLSLPLPPAVG